MQKESRSIHRKAAPLVFLPVFITTITGMGYRIGRSWFGGSEAFGDLMMSLHEGQYLGKSLVPLYVLLVGLGLLGMVATGAVMARSQRRGKTSPGGLAPQRSSRWIHRVLAPIAALPVLATALTGMGYRLGKAWFGLSPGQADLLMTIHQGSWLGSTLRPFYVLLVGLSLIALLLTGFQMMGLVPRRKPPVTPKV